MSTGDILPYGSVMENDQAEAVPIDVEMKDASEPEPAVRYADKPSRILPAVPSSKNSVPEQKKTNRKSKISRFPSLLKMNLAHPFHPLPLPYYLPQESLADLATFRNLNHEYSIVVEDLPEYDICEEITPSVRRSLDQASVNSILAFYGLDSPIVFSFRMGIYSKYRPRPLKIVFPTRHAVSNLVSSFNRFGRPKFPSIFACIHIRRSDPSRSSFTNTSLQNPTSFPKIPSQPCKKTMPNPNPSKHMAPTPSKPQPKKVTISQSSPKPTSKTPISKSIFLNSKKVENLIRSTPFRSIHKRVKRPLILKVKLPEPPFLGSPAKKKNKVSSP